MVSKKFVGARWPESLEINILGISLQPFNCYANTVENMLVALQKRVYISQPAWNPPRCTKRIARELAHKIGKRMGPLLSIEESTAHYQVSKREMYRAAHAETLQNRFFRGDVSSFVKREYTAPKASVQDEKTRAIQFRHPQMQSRMQRWYKVFEHTAHEVSANHWQPRTCAKGRSPYRRMLDLLWMVNFLADCHVVALDGSAWDAHIGVPALKMEWDAYLTCLHRAGYPGWVISDAIIQRRYQLKNKCRARCVDGTIKYRVDGNRMSGDVNTGAGNSFLNQVYLKSAMRHLNIPDGQWCMYVDGDDAVLFVAGAYARYLSELPETMAMFSQEVKMGDICPVNSDHMEPIDFCQAQPVKVGGSWRLIRNPTKVISGSYSRDTRWFANATHACRYWKTVAEAELILNSGVPVLHSYFEHIHGVSDAVKPGCKPLLSVARRWYLRAAKAVFDPHLAPVAAPSSEIDIETRISFQTAFGITPAEQTVLEEGFRSSVSQTVTAIRQLPDLEE